mmetsp:Transcript_6946/g.20472  ORF Transcript_6946/g.20472 Transcript_6946/m.20472 type:complete len:349 (+) Transcript_6946:237-1283(+)
MVPPCRQMGGCSGRKCGASPLLGSAPLRMPLGRPRSLLLLPRGLGGERLGLLLEGLGELLLLADLDLAQHLLGRQHLLLVQLVRLQVAAHLGRRDLEGLGPLLGVGRAQLDAGGLHHLEEADAEGHAVEAGADRPEGVAERTLLALHVAEDRGGGGLLGVADRGVRVGVHLLGVQAQRRAVGLPDLLALRGATHELVVGAHEAHVVLPEAEREDRVVLEAAVDHGHVGGLNLVDEEGPVHRHHRGRRVGLVEVVDGLGHGPHRVLDGRGHPQRHGGPGLGGGRGGLAARHEGAAGRPGHGGGGEDAHGQEAGGAAAGRAGGLGGGHVFCWGGGWWCGTASPTRAMRET